MHAPNPDLDSLSRLVGTWRLSGDAQGTNSYEWMDGRFFLVQRVDFEHDGRTIRGLEIIGHEKPFGGEPGEDIGSRFYDNAGNTLDYVYEIEADTLTIWGGEKGSPAYYKGTFTDDDNTLTGGWTWPGGGYETIARRVR